MANPFSYDAEREVYTASLADGRTLQIDRVEFEAAEAFFARGDLNNPAESGDFEQVYNPETWRGAEGNGPRSAKLPDLKHRAHRAARHRKK